MDAKSSKSCEAAESKLYYVSLEFGDSGKKSLNMTIWFRLNHWVQYFTWLQELSRLVQ